MSKKITLAADLTGGGQVARELEGIGQSGKAALQGLEDAAKKMAAPMGRLQTAIHNLGKAFEPVRTSGRDLRDSLSDVGDAAGTVGRRLGIVTAAATATGAAIVGLSNATAQHAKTIRLYAQQTGASEESLQAFAFAARTVGVDLDDAAEAYRDFMVRVGEAKAGEQLALDNFRAVGITKAEVAALSPRDLFDAWVEGLGRLDQASRTFRVDELLSDAGTRLLPLIDRGVAGIRALEAEGRRYAMTRQEITDAAAYSEAAQRLGAAFESMRHSVAAVLMPALTEGANAVRDFLATNREAVTAFVALQWDRVASLVRDLIALAQGRDGDVKARWLTDLRDKVAALGTSVDQAVNGIIAPAFRVLMGILDTAAAGLNAVFGTNISGQALGIGLVVLKTVGVFSLLAATIGTVGPAVSLLTAAFTAARSAITATAGAMGALSAASLANPFVLAALAIAAAVGLIAYNWDSLKKAIGFGDEADKAAASAEQLADAAASQAEATLKAADARGELSAITTDLAEREADFARTIEASGRAVDGAGAAARRAVTSLDMTQDVEKATESMKTAYQGLQTVLDETLTKQLAAADKLAEAQRRSVGRTPEARRVEEEARAFEMAERRKTEAVNQWAARATLATRNYYTTAIDLARRAGQETEALQREMLTELGKINQRREQELSATVDRLIAEEQRRRDAAVAAAEDAAAKIKGINASLRDLELSLLSPERQYRAKESDIRAKKAEASALLAAGEYEKAKALAEEIAADAIANASTAETTKRTVAAARKSAEFAKRLIEEATAQQVQAEEKAAANAAQQAAQVQAQLSLVQQQIAQIRQAEATLAGLKVVIDVSKAITSLQAVQDGLAGTKARVLDTAAAFDSLAASANRAGAAMRSASGANGGSDSDSAPGYAGGGAIVGPGTGTSDSILMWGSNGEFVQRARAVRAAGVDFMAALNRVRSHSDFTRLIQSVANAAPRFANGGLLQLPSPASIAAGLSNRLTAGLTMPTLNPVMPDLGALAAAGSVGRPLNIYLPGGERVQVTAQEHEARKLERLSNGLGRGPRWMGVGK